MFVTSNPLFPLKVWNSSFMAFDNDFSPTLLNNVARSCPTFGNPMIRAINLVSINIGGESHNIPPLMQLSSNLTQLLISMLHPKWGISIRFNIHDFSSLVAHVYGFRIISPVPDTLFEHKYVSLSNSGNFFSSVIS